MLFASALLLHRSNWKAQKRHNRNASMHRENRDATNARDAFSGRAMQRAMGIYRNVTAGSFEVYMSRTRGGQAAYGVRKVDQLGSAHRNQQY